MKLVRWTTEYLLTNRVQGTHAADNLMLDWSDVAANGIGTGSDAPQVGTMCGLALKFRKTKNNPERDEEDPYLWGFVGICDLSRQKIMPQCRSGYGYWEYSRTGKW
jgi:hypothetical protein